MHRHRELGITQKAAWYLGHRIRAAMDFQGDLFQGPVEVDETLIGGLKKNKPLSVRKKNKWGSIDHLIPIAGIKDRKTNRVIAQVVPDRTAPTLQGFVMANTEPDALVYTDEAAAYKGIMRKHRSVNHKAEQYVDGDVTTNGMEGFWSPLKGGLKVIYKHWSEKHAQKYVTEFSGRHNIRPLDTEDQMGEMVREGEGRQMTYQELIQ